MLTDVEHFCYTIMTPLRYKLDNSQCFHILKCKLQEREDGGGGGGGGGGGAGEIDRQSNRGRERQKHTERHTICMREGGRGEREREKVSWCFTPSQPVRLYQGKRERNYYKTEE